MESIGDVMLHGLAPCRGKARGEQKPARVKLITVHRICFAVCAY